MVEIIVQNVNCHDQPIWSVRRLRQEEPVSRERSKRASSNLFLKDLCAAGAADVNVDPRDNLELSEQDRGCVLGRGEEVELSVFFEP